MKILITGGLGYLGLHTCAELIRQGYDVVILDNLSNSSPSALSSLRTLVKADIKFLEGDIRDFAFLKNAFHENQFDAVIHFAGVKAVNESVIDPIKYFDINVAGSINLINVMERFGVRRLIFSSSATVYGPPFDQPIKEDHIRLATSPYGLSKLLIEDILIDLHRSIPEWKICILRYFNPIGAHKSGLIGENPNGIPNNLMPYITRVAMGELPFLPIYGNDYPTRDGTGVRDFIHVMDLAEGHIAAIEMLSKIDFATINLGTGKGTSVFELVTTFEEVIGRKIPIQILPRRQGDVAECFADVTKAKNYLNWTSKRGLKEMCADSWKWQISMFD